MDRSFQGLAFSLIVHAIMVWLLLHAKSPEFTFREAPTEIEFVETKKTKAFVSETQNKPDDTFEKLKAEADYLSKYTKRVREETKALLSGKTQNGSAYPDLRSERSKRGLSDLRPLNTEDGIGQRSGAQLLREEAIGISSVSEHIPGVKVGAFTALNSDQFTYYSFFSRMNEQIRNRWITAVRRYVDSLSTRDLAVLSQYDRQTVVEIILSKDGDFIKSVIHNSAGDQRLDMTSVEAFRLAAPFINPPTGLVESDGYIRIKYGFYVQFKPPSLGPDM